MSSFQTAPGVWQVRTPFVLDDASTLNLITVTSHLNDDRTVTVKNLPANRVVSIANSTAEAVTLRFGDASRPRLAELRPAFLGPGVSEAFVFGPARTLMPTSTFFSMWAK